MCGIAGLIALDKSATLPYELLPEMCDRMAHRGPDGEGFLYSQHIPEGFTSKQRSERPRAHINTTEVARPLALGHRRLSIIDLASVAAQPMADATNRYWVVFNGELYNHKELRSELEQKGFQFKTNHSDTEVLINAYAAWGTEAVQRFRGMFAFVLHDREEDVTWIVRDRLGVKPFYYAVKGGVFRFGSEIKTIMADPSMSRELNQEGLYDYFSFLAVAAPNTIFKAVHKLEPAHFMLIRNGELSSPKRYWDPLEVDVVDRSEKEVMDGLLDQLEQSAKYRMEADVDYGVLLSGGIDSSANLRMLSRQTEKPIKAFSIGFSNEFPNYKNEFEFSRKVARQFGAEYYEIELSPEKFNEFFPKMVWYQDEPIADTANIPIYYISKEAKDNGVTVLLGGEGSDELLIGYAHWNLAYKFYQTFEARDQKLKTRLVQLAHRMPVVRDKRPLYRDWYPKHLKNQTVFWGGGEYGTESMKDAMISADMKSRLNGYSSYQVIEKYYNHFLKSGRSNYLDYMSFVDLNYRLPELLLARLDRMTMAASVEGRVPFMDHEFVEYCMSIPAHMKLKDGVEKYLLKRAFEGILPFDVLYRPKEGFPVPLNSILFNDEFTADAQTQIRNFNQDQSLWDNAYLERLFAQGSGKEFWNALNLSLWYKAIV